mmetsp:Transcript_44857/g.81825  ORF Transcript_44857/g.81825 Transcript_44857/m.81825 type:complete len:306 (-) Transcript_44857:24-941(-)
MRSTQSSLPYTQGYSAIEKPLKTHKPSKANLPNIALGLFLPWITFSVCFACFSFSLHYDKPAIAYMISAILLVAVLAFGFLALNAIRKRRAGKSAPDPVWFLFICLTGLASWCAGVFLGDLNFWHYSHPYYDLVNMQAYPNIAPDSRRGQQLMDAARISFTEGSYIDLQKSTGFRNLDWFCVAPITAGSNTDSTYDFWAVGLNCCQGTPGDFHCGEYNNPAAMSGLRVMREDQQAFYRLAVEQASAMHKVKADHPIFVYWMQDPLIEMNAYMDQAFKYFMMGVFMDFSFQLFLVLSLLLCTASMG